MRYLYNVYKYIFSTKNEIYKIQANIRLSTKNIYVKIDSETK